MEATPGRYLKRVEAADSRMNRRTRETAEEKGQNWREIREYFRRSRRARAGGWREGYFSRRLRNWRVESLISRQADGLCRASAASPSLQPLDLPVQATAILLVDAEGKI